MRFLIGSAAVLAVLTATPALADVAKPKPDRSACFRPADIAGFMVIDDETVDVRISPKNVYRLKLFMPAPDIDWSQRIGIDARGQNWVCSGMEAEIIVPGNTGRQRYPVSDVRKLTLEEIKAPTKKR